MPDVTVVGGVYREVCMWPPSDEVYGSGGRAACSLAKQGVHVRLIGFADKIADSTMRGHADQYGFEWAPVPISSGVAFYYSHGLATPAVRDSEGVSGPINVSDECVLRFGMWEGDANVSAARVVYDPQSAYSPQRFSANGSKAEKLAVVLNRREALTLLGSSGELSSEEIARKVAKLENAAVVVLKQGPHGAMVLENDRIQLVPSYETTRVAKIGSGDQFTAHFAFGWMVSQLSAADSAAYASKATAYFCERRDFPSKSDLEGFEPRATSSGHLSASKNRVSVYLAGPFFSLAQMWIVEEARRHLSELGLEVFSPFHDIGRGDAARVVPMDLRAIRDCDFVFAIADGLDSGTVYEVGYARALGRPVVVYSESETAENLKMMEGSDCFMCHDFVSAIYRAAWIAGSL